MRFVLAAIFVLGGLRAAADPEPATREYQIKAVFLFNFVQFVDWPPQAFPQPQSPLVIGILGEDPFDSYIDEAVRGEKVNDHPLVVQRYRRPEDIGPCHVLFISRSETGHLAHVLTSLKGRSILTVGDMAGFAERGGMIRFVTENNKIRLQINVDAARAADLTISSKLLEPAQIVTPGNG
ncbi:MAG TPA: YfiR family protein [Opitutaceae bacterium]|nr:YfiR family protein [Opitutaceae bacterium]